MAALTLLLAACAEPSDILYTQPLVTGVEVAPGLFQVTVDPNPDQVRGFTPTGDTILFRALRNTANGPRWEMLGIPAAGGVGFVEHAGLYRAALRVSLGTLVSGTEDRLLTWWLPGNDGTSFGPAGCFRVRTLPVWTFAVLRLEPQDGAPLSGIPSREVVTPTATTTLDTPGLISFRLRFTPAEVDADLGANPFGPAIAPAATTGFYSDGDAVWRFDPSSPGTAADSIGPGFYPAVSPDGALLARVVPQGADSATTKDSVSGGLRSCTQVNVSYTAATWTTVVTRLATGDTVAKLNGTEPVFDPAGARVLVRRATGLVFVDLASKAETALENTTGAFAVAISPSGQYVAFSRGTKNVDVFYVKLK
jgi:hypothetical protein